MRDRVNRVDFCMELDRYSADDVGGLVASIGLLGSEEGGGEGR